MVTKQIEKPRSKGRRVNYYLPEDVIEKLEELARAKRRATGDAASKSSVIADLIEVDFFRVFGAHEINK